MSADAAIRQNIIAAVDGRAERIVALLQELIQFDSETGREGPIQGFIAETLRGLGLAVDVWEPDVAALQGHPAFLPPGLPLAGRPNVVGVWRGRGGGRSLLFNGHVDTVPADPLDRWVDGAFAGTVRDGNLYGRGASDMKSGVAAMTMAVATLVEMGLRPKGDVTLEYVVDEEWTGIGTLACVERGYRADAGICAETSNLEVTAAAIGRVWFSVELTGKPAGISARWESVSAIEKGIKIVQAVDDLEKIRIADLHHPLYPDNRGALPCAVTTFNAGTFPSVTPERAVLKGSLGLMPYEKVEDVKAQLCAQIEHVALADPWLRHHPPLVTFNEGLVVQGAEIPVDHPIVQAVSSAFVVATGREPVYAGRKGAADTRFLIHYGHTPTVIFGPGLTPQMHAMNEYVPVENLLTATKVMALTIQEWCNQRSPKRPSTPKSAGSSATKGGDPNTRTA